ncbi:AAA family ATPase [Streptomyces sp. NPDC058470]|uniref:nSTAND1 domain-containing NTPase n=1 Tax=Streptomyces sp. NPDC058470 TaxID=3346515 RepID=UPI003647C38B
MEALSSDSGARTAFAERLALLYREAGNPPLNRVAEAVVRLQRIDEKGRPVRVSAQRISDWRRARNVPAQFAALASVLQILIPEARRSRSSPVSPGLYDLVQWQRLWEQALADPVGDRASAAATSAASAEGDEQSGLEASTGVGVCPYRGLASYRQEDARWFFGRERSTDALIAQLGAAEDTGGLVMLVGASGAGKSSLLNAGLVPALRDGARDDDSPARVVLQLVPGGDPLAELTDRIPELAQVVLPTQEPAAKDPGTRRFAHGVREAVTAWARREAADGSRPVLIVDQFEEAFTLCPDEAQRRAFIQVLHAACSPADPGDPAPVLVVLGIRADFYEQCLRYPELADALQHRHMVLGPLATAELREAVTGPAKAVGLELEPGLAELIVRELSADGPRGTHDAGVLPLLSHALLATWQRRKAGRLTLAGYRAAGGIQGAVAATAERAWSGLDPAARTAARLLLLRLVRLGEDTQATRRRGTRRQLAAESTDPGKTEESLEALVRARLVTLDAETVEITHEALLHAWPRLRDWIDEDKNSNLLRQRLEEDGRAWEGSSRDTSLLYRGSRLEQARAWAKSAGDTFLTRSAVEFLAASVRLRKRTVWIGRGAVAALVVLAMLAVGSAVVAWQQRNDAVFEQVVAEADRVQYTDPSLSAQLDLVAHRLRPDDEGANNRLISIVNAPLATPLLGHTGAVYLTSFSPNGRILATASYDRTVRLWDVSEPTRPKQLGKPLTGHTSWVSSAVFSPDGGTLASASDDGTIRLWNVQDPGHPHPLGAPLAGHGGTIYLLAFSPDGQTLASANEDHVVRLWDVREPGRAKELGELTGATAAVRSVAFSPDGRTLAAGGDDDAVRLWDVADPRRAKRIDKVLTGHTDLVHSVAFSPDGRTLASGSADNTVRLWDVAPPDRPAALGDALTPAETEVRSLAFSPDGRTLAALTAGAVQLWDVTDPSRPVSYGPVELRTRFAGPDTLAFSPDGHTLATAYEDRTIQLWDATDPSRLLPLGKPLPGHKGYVNSLVFSPDSSTLASGSADDTIRLWNVADPRHATQLGAPLTGHLGPVNALSYSPDGHTLASGSDDDTVRLWNVADPLRTTPLGSPLTGHTEAVVSLTFSQDGHTLASGGNDNTVRLWNVAAPSDASPIGQSMSPNAKTGNFLSFSPKSHMLGVSSGADTVRLWDLDVDEAIHRICLTTRGVLTSAKWHEYLPRLSYDPPCDQ